MVSQAGLTDMNYYLPSFPIYETTFYIVIYSLFIIPLSKVLS